jgi:hexosaminidase
MAEQDCFRASLLTKTNEYPEAELQINCTRNGKIEINEDESYRQQFSNRIAIDAYRFRCLHGLETLCNYYKTTVLLLLSIVEISDAPRFTWRGLMIDAARHFQPVDVIKRNLDAMASMKMNVFIGI